MEIKAQFTDTQVIEDAVRTIGNLRLPVEFEEEIGQLSRVRKNLIAVLEAIRKAADMDIQAMDAGEMTPEEIIQAAEDKNVEG